MSGAERKKKQIKLAGLRQSAASSASENYLKIAVLGEGPGRPVGMVEMDRSANRPAAWRDEVSARDAF
ncbi:MAG: hypothetical protein BA871_12850 [Desulfuromonadales bacterium C00003096]|nr:MAG: hypothetical protein BA871_12850 [Desulfuromonadales bacterium C00003096]